MHDFTPVPALIGGGLIGLAASLLLLTHGKVAGVSGIYGGLLRQATTDKRFRLLFLAGLVLPGAVAWMVWPGALSSRWVPGLPLALVAGLLVGLGTQLGNGCTSGHGVCGLSRLSPRSLVATLTFIATGILTVALRGLLFGSGR